MAAWLCRDLPDYSWWSNDPGVGVCPACRFIGDPRAVAGSSWEAIMAGLVVVTLVIIVMGACVGALLRISFAIRREDRSRGSLRLDAPNNSAQTARTLVGLTSSRWD
jgi:hypothetical protein